MKFSSNASAFMRFTGRYRRAFFFVLTLIAFGVHFALSLSPKALQEFELETLESDYAKRLIFEQTILRGEHIEKIEDIVILAFDQSFSEEQYRNVIDDEPALKFLAKPRGLKYDRALYAMILDRLMNAGARIVLFDFLFEGKGYADEVSGKDIEDTGNHMFAESLKNSHERVVIGSLIQAGEHVVSIKEPYELLLDSLSDTDADRMIGFVNVGLDEHSCISRSVLSANRLVLGNPNLDKSNLKPDVFSLASRAAQKLRKPLPDDLSEALINYAGPGGTFPKVPVQDIFVPENWKNRFGGGAYFKDKIVIVGPYSEIHYKDYYRTPIGAMFGVEVQANCLNNALRGNWLIDLFSGKRALWWTALFAFGIWALFTNPWIASSRPGRMLFFSALALGGLLLFRWISFCVFNWVLPGFSLSVATSLAVVFVGMDFLRTHYERSRIHDLFGSYLPAEIVRKMVEKGDDPELGGENVVLTSLFADVQSFSTFSEQLSAGDLVELMNEFFGAMTTVIDAQEGTLDKYAGDSVIAMFGAPVPMPKHAVHACRCALAMQVKLAELRRRHTRPQDSRSDAISAMRMRIGINTGPAVVGNMGSSLRFNYTMMGDSVNLAARCESGAKTAGVYILTTQATVEAVGGLDKEFVFRKIDLWRVKGRHTPVSVYELICRRSELTREIETCLAMHAAGLTFYFERKWSEALAKFEEASAFELLRPGIDAGVLTNPSLVMAARCREFLDTPPAADWDGVYEPGKG